jgi:uncharacterized protein
MAMDNTMPSRPISRKVWIDVENTPQVPFFYPIIRELQRLGCATYVTARDAFQVCDMADLYHLDYRRVGRHYGKHKVMKVLGTGCRALQLEPLTWRQKPDLAVSHGSRSQLMAAKLARIPALLISDYEFSSAVPGMGPAWVLVPDLMPESAVQFAGARVLKYPGLKEDVYVPDFKPDPSIMSRLGVEEGRLVVTLRPPATEAHYHNPESDVLFDAVLDLLSRSDETQVVLLPRNGKQALAIRAAWPHLFSQRKIVIPEHAVDGLDLIWYSDLVVSGGGTMNREAAAMDVPVFSIFRGRIGAVDRHLAQAGRLVLLESVADVRTKLVLKRRPRPAHAEMGARPALTSIVGHITAILTDGGLVGAASSPPGAG